MIRWRAVRLRVRNHRVFDQGARGARLLKAGPPPVAGYRAQGCG